jgi:hypothetical protein
MQNITGTWTCGDGLTYFITQSANDILLLGMGNSSYNVGTGTINPSDNTIVLTWADTPNSNGYGNHGICFLDASQNGVIRKKDGSQNFGIGNFTKKA